MLTNGFTKKKYNALLVSSLLGWIVSLLGELSDGVIAGIFINEDAVSAVSLVTPIFSFLFFVSGFIAQGTAILFSRASGAFDSEKSQKICGMGLSMSWCA